MSTRLTNNDEWNVTQLTWASTAKLTKVSLLPTIDPRLAHKTGLVAALAKTLGYDSAAGWYKARVAQQGHARLPPLPGYESSVPELHYASSHFNVVSPTRIKSLTTNPRCLLTLNLAHATSHNIPLGTTSQLPVHDQAWAYADRLSKQDEIFYSYINYVPSKIQNEPARPLLIASRLRQARYKLTYEPGKAKHVKKQGTKWESHLAQMMRAVAILHEAVQTQRPYMDRDALPNFELTAKAAGPPTEYSTLTDITDIALTPPSADAAKTDATTHHSHASIRLPSAMAIQLHRTFAEMQPAVTAITQMRARAAVAAQAATAQLAAAQAATAHDTTARTPLHKLLQARPPPNQPHSRSPARLPVSKI
jgi:hypothetical protein